MSDWKKLIDDFCIDMQTMYNFKEQSLITYRRKLEVFARNIEKLPSKITEYDLQRWKVKLLSKESSNNTLRQIHSVIKRFFTWYSHKNKIANPAINLRAIPEIIKDPFVPEPAEVAQMISFADDKTQNGRRNAAIIALFAGTGIRPSEMEALLYKDITVKSRQYFVVDAPVRKTRSRRIPFGNIGNMDIIASTFGLYYLEIQQNGILANSPLFFYEAAQEVKVPLRKGTIWRIVRRYGDQVNPSKLITPTSLRHFFATYLTMNNINIEELRHYMGHALLSTTQRYIHIAARLRSNTPKLHPLAKIKRSDQTKLKPIIQAL